MMLLFSDLHIGDDPDFQLVHSFLEQIPQDVLARASFQCRAYARSLMHCEAFINKNKHNLQQQLGFLQVITNYEIAMEDTLVCSRPMGIFP